MSKHLASVGRKKSPLTGRNLQRHHAQGGVVICCYNYNNNDCFIIGMNNHRLNVRTHLCQQFSGGRRPNYGKDVRKRTKKNVKEQKRKGPSQRLETHEQQKSQSLQSSNIHSWSQNQRWKKKPNQKNKTAGEKAESDRQTEALCLSCSHTSSS